MITVTVQLELVESLLAENTRYTGTVLLCELRDSMQTFLSQGLMRGCKVSLRDAFDFAWSELVDEEMSECDYEMPS